MEFAKGTGPTFIKHVDNLLNIITSNDHQKYIDSKKSAATASVESNGKNELKETEITNDTNTLKLAETSTI